MWPFSRGKKPERGVPLEWSDSHRREIEKVCSIFSDAADELGRVETEDMKLVGDLMSIMFGATAVEGKSRRLGREPDNQGVAKDLAHNIGIFEEGIDSAIKRLKKLQGKATADPDIQEARSIALRSFTTGKRRFDALMDKLESG